MKKILKRLLLIIGFPIAIFIGVFYWIITGKAPETITESFTDYCTK